jgi:hypothetical protein
MGVRISTVTCGVCACCGHPGGRRTAGGRRADTPAGGGQVDTPAGATLQGGIYAYAMGEGGYGGSPIGEAGKAHQQRNGHTYCNGHQAIQIHRQLSRQLLAAFWR